ncbi:MAG: carbonic anhydrase family protein [Proteobacteria bacterium]|nr:carbonic anhydrase family protein [Pseudomonadota bacterium]
MYKFLRITFYLTVSFLSVAIASAEEKAKWSYHGNTGPEFWSKLSSGPSSCGGRQQSPIEIRSGDAIAADLPPMFMDLQQFKPDIINDGHKIEVTPRGNGGLSTYDGVDYNLVEIQFHMTSEHQIDDISYPMEAHFFHRSKAGDWLALAVLFIESEENRVLQTILDRAPDKVGRASSNQVIDPMLLIPVDTRFFRYKGSLTLPPCTENVTWHIYKEPLGASKKQLEAFARLYPDNHRPLQELNRRYVLQGQ